MNSPPFALVRAPFLLCVLLFSFCPASATRHWPTKNHVVFFLFLRSLVASPTPRRLGYCATSPRRRHFWLARAGASVPAFNRRQLIAQSKLAARCEQMLDRCRFLLLFGADTLCLLQRDHRQGGQNTSLLRPGNAMQEREKLGCIEWNGHPPDRRGHHSFAR